MIPQVLDSRKNSLNAQMGKIFSNHGSFLMKYATSSTVFWQLAVKRWVKHRPNRLAAPPWRCLNNLCTPSDRGPVFFPPCYALIRTCEPTCVFDWSPWSLIQCLYTFQHKFSLFNSTRPAIPKAKEGLWFSVYFDFIREAAMCDKS
jgi:hypothetical protein